MRGRVVASCLLVLATAVAAWFWSFGDVAPPALANGDAPQPSTAPATLVASTESAPAATEAGATAAERTAAAPQPAPPADAPTGTVVRGTIVAVDGKTESTAENGTMQASVRMPARDGESFYRHENVAVTVTAGAFEFRVPHVPTSVTFDEITLGERGALCPDEFAVAGAGVELTVRARWLQSLSLRVLADDTGADLADLTIAQGGDWRHERHVHPGVAPDVVAAHARSPVRLQPRAGRGTERYWVKAPGYAWNQIEMSTIEAAERVLRLVPGGGVELALDGKPPPGAVIRIRETDSSTEADLTGMVVAEFAGRPGLLRVDALPARAWTFSLEKGEWFENPIQLGHTLVTIVAGTTGTATLVVKAFTKPAMVKVAGTLLVSPDWGTDLKVTMAAMGSAKAWQREPVRIELAQMAKVAANEYRWAAVEMPAGRHELHVEGTEFRTLVEVADAPTADLRIVVPDPNDVRVRFLDAETGQPIEWTGAEVPGWYGTVNGWESGWSHAPMTAEGDGWFRFRAPAGRINIGAHPAGYQWAHGDHEVRPGPNEFVLRIERICGVEIELKDGDATIPWPDSIHVMLEHTTTKSGVAYWSGNKTAAEQAGEHKLMIESPGGFEPITPRVVVVERGKWTKVVVELKRKS